MHISKHKKYSFIEVVAKAFSNLESGKGLHDIMNVENRHIVKIGWDNVYLLESENNGNRWEDRAGFTTKSILKDKWILYKETYECNKCGESLGDNNNFCSDCGVKIKRFVEFSKE